MDTALFWAIAAVVVAIVLGIAQAIGYWRSHPRRQIVLTTTSRRILADGPGADHVAVSAQGNEIPDPHFVEVQVRSNSRADIPSSSFDSGDAITIHMSSHCIGVGDHDSDGMYTTGAFTDDEGRTVIEIGPQLIRRGAEVRLAMISSGPCVAEIAAPLIDIDVRNYVARPAAYLVRALWMTNAAIISLGLGVLIAILAQRP